MALVPYNRMCDATSGQCSPTGCYCPCLHAILTYDKITRTTTHFPLGIAICNHSFHERLAKLRLIWLTALRGNEIYFDQQGHFCDSVIYVLRWVSTTPSLPGPISAHRTVGHTIFRHPSLHIYDTLQFSNERSTFEEILMTAIARNWFFVDFAHPMQRHCWDINSKMCFQ